MKKYIVSVLLGLSFVGSAFAAEKLSEQDREKIEQKARLMLAQAPLVNGFGFFMNVGLFEELCAKLGENKASQMIKEETALRLRLREADKASEEAKKDDK